MWGFFYAFLVACPCLSFFWMFCSFWMWWAILADRKWEFNKQFYLLISIAPKHQSLYRPKEIMLQLAIIIIDYCFTELQPTP